jgi:hypothetical protein
VDFALFRPELERAGPRADGTKGGRPAFDHVLMFKILLLQAMHGLSDERCECLIKDRLSFMRFLGLGLADPVPDANTIWAFREAPKRAAAVERLFAQFDAMLGAAGYLAMGGQIVDATTSGRARPSAVPACRRHCRGRTPPARQSNGPHGSPLRGASPPPDAIRRRLRASPRRRKCQP